jgi:DNA (cytosine-5)-methyltransferase 1
MTGDLRVRDLFAGTGWGVACQKLDWKEDGVEIMPEAQATRAAAGMKTIASDVRTVEPVRGEYDIEIASPSCKRYSAAGNGAGRRALEAVLAGVARYAAGQPLSWDEAVALIGDEDAALTLEPLRVALGSMPRFIAWEQVPAVLPVWQACAAVLEDRGYSTATAVLNAEQYGVPQTRRRAFLLARRDGIAARMPSPTHSRYHLTDPRWLDAGVLPWISMCEALGWGMTQRPSMTVTGGGTDTGGAEPFGNAARRGMLREVVAGRWIGHETLRSGQQSRTGLRPERTADAPSMTIMGTSDRYHWQDEGRRVRNLSPDEAALLQTFPVGFPFQGTKGRRMQQIGNAVPPALALAVLRTFQTGGRS